MALACIFRFTYCRARTNLLVQGGVLFNIKVGALLVYTELLYAKLLKSVINCEEFIVKKLLILFGKSLSLRLL